MTSRIIIHLDMDAFFAAIEERENPHFRGKPLVVGADPKGGWGRGVVSTANYRARKHGIHSAIPISQAYKLCPDAIYLPPNFELYTKVSANIMHIIREFSPFVEQVSLDEAYIDLSKNFTIVKITAENEVWKEAEKIAEEMRKAIWVHEKLTCSCGVGPNKMIAKIACEEAKPNGVRVVQEGDEEAFIENLDIQKIPGIGVKTARILRSSGLEKVSDLKRLSLDDMKDLFGKRGEVMYLRARGIDGDPVMGEREIKSIGKEVTFERDTRDPELLIRTFEKLVKQVAREAEEQALTFKQITVVCRLSGFETHTKSKTLREPSSNEGVMRSEAMKLLLRFLLEKQKPVRLIGVRITIASGLELWYDNIEL